MPDKRKQKKKKNSVGKSGVSVRVVEKVRVAPPQRTRKARKRTRNPKSGRMAAPHVCCVATNLYNPFINCCVLPAPANLGRLTPIHSTISFNWNITTGNDNILFMKWLPHSLSVMMTSYATGAPSDPMPWTLDYSSQLGNGLNLGSLPTQIKPGRYGIQFLNTTSMMNMGGNLYYTPVYQWLQYPTDWTATGVDGYIWWPAADCTDLVNTITTNDLTKIYPFSSLHEKTFFMVPNVQANYDQFYNFQNGTSFNNIPASILVAKDYISIAQARPMTDMAFYIPSPQANQTLTVVVKRMDYCTYPLGTALSSSAIKPPFISPVQSSALTSIIHNDLTKTGGVSVPEVRAVTEKAAEKPGFWSSLLTGSESMMDHLANLFQGIGSAGSGIGSAVASVKGAPSFRLGGTQTIVSGSRPRILP